MCVAELNPIELLWGGTKRVLKGLLDGTHTTLKLHLAPTLLDIGNRLDYVRGWFVHVQRYVVAYGTAGPTTLGDAFTAVRKLKSSHRTPTCRMEVLFGVPAASIPAQTRALFGVYIVEDDVDDDVEEGADPAAGPLDHVDDGPEHEDDDADADDAAFAQAIAQAVVQDNGMMDTSPADEELLENDDDDGSTSDRDDDFEE